MFAEGSGDGLTDWSIQGDRGRELARLQEGDRHQEKIPFEFGQELLLPEPAPHPFVGAIVLVTPIESHCDFKHICAFYGGIVYDFHVELRIMLLMLNPSQLYQKSFLTKLKKVTNFTN